MANIPEFISVLRRIRDEIYPEVEEMYENTATLKSEAGLSKSAAAASAAAAASSAGIATTRANEIKNVSAQANTLSSGSAATVSYNSADGKFTFGIPSGAKGDKGESYTINATGLTVGRELYDAQQMGFSYLDISLSIVYFKLSSTSGDWSAGTSFGRGKDGEDGTSGVGIVNVVFYSTTSSSGLPSELGGVDTYRITLSNSNTYDFSVSNGEVLDINEYQDKTTLSNGDSIAIADSESLFSIKKISWSNLKEKIISYIGIENGFSSLKSTNGYIKLPNWLGGFIIQWGVSSLINQSSVVVTFPVSYTTSPLFNIAAARSGAQTSTVLSTDIGSNSQLTIYANTTTTITASWLSIGY